MRMADPALWSFRLERDRAPCEQSSHHVQFHAIKGFSQIQKQLNIETGTCGAKTNFILIQILLTRWGRENADRLSFKFLWWIFEFLNMCEFNPCDSESLHMQAFIKVYFDPTKVWIFETSQDIVYWFKNGVRGATVRFAVLYGIVWILYDISWSLFALIL